MAEPTVTHKPGKDPSTGRFELDGDGRQLGYLTYSLTDGDTLCVEYVEVSPALRGKKMGNRLVEAAVEWARQNGRQVMAHCSFARAVLERTPRFKDVLKQPHRRSLGTA